MTSKTIINIAKTTGLTPLDSYDATQKYQHFFRIEIEGHPGGMEVTAVIDSIVERYPMPEFKVSVTYFEVKGREISMALFT